MSRVLLLLLALYFGLMLLPHFVPAAGETVWSFYYMLSVPVVLLVLLGCAVAWLFVRKRPLLIVALGGLLMFPVALLASQLLARGLPTGSYTRPFDVTAWRAAGAADFVEGDITPRQKMLGQVVHRVLPGRTRAEIEALLGPSLDTSYFVETGRDLIYVTGPERTSLFAIDSEWLLIWLDEQGRFERYQIVTD